MTGRTIDLRGSVPDGSPTVTIITTERRWAHIASLIEQDAQRKMDFVERAFHSVPECKP